MTMMRLITALFPLKHKVNSTIYSSHWSFEFYTFMFRCLWNFSEADILRYSFATALCIFFTILCDGINFDVGWEVCATYTSLHIVKGFFEAWKIIYSEIRILDGT